MLEIVDADSKFRVSSMSGQSSAYLERKQLSSNEALKEELTLLKALLSNFKQIALTLRSQFLTDVMSNCNYA
jgi:hypothetical protein